MARPDAAGVELRDRGDDPPGGHAPARLRVDRARLQEARTGGGTRAAPADVPPLTAQGHRPEGKVHQLADLVRGGASCLPDSQVFPQSTQLCINLGVCLCITHTDAPADIRKGKANMTHSPGEDAAGGARVLGAQDHGKSLEFLIV